MDSMEKSHALQSSVVSTLFSARQLIWTELSTIISDIKDMFDQANNERNREWERLLLDNQSLTEVLSRMKEIIEGKELEIHGLRRQLQSFYTTKPLCSSCSREINSSNDFAINKGNRQANEKSSSHRPLLYSFEHEPRKRLRSNTSISSSSPVVSNTENHVVHHQWDKKPAQKRQCTRASVDALPSFPIVLLRDTQMLEEDFVENKTKRRNSRAATAQQQRAAAEHINIKKPPPTPKNRMFRMTELSPPTQQFDASLAIENAVNHSDLAGAECTQLDSMASTTTYVQDTADEQESITLSMDAPQDSSKFVFRRPYSKNRSRLVASHLLNRHLGFGFGSHRNRRSSRTMKLRHSSSRNVHKRRKGKEPDTDASLPTDFLDSECTMLISETKPIINHASSSSCQQTKETITGSDRHLPSVGGSPTSHDTNIFKRPNPPAAHLPLSHPNQASAALTLDDLETQLPTQPEGAETAQKNKEQGVHLADILEDIDDQENRPPMQPIVSLQPLDKESTVPSAEIKYVGPVERSKEARRKLIGHSCATCKEYYTSLGLSSPEVTDRLHRCSRHRAINGAPPSTPKGFWDIGIFDSETQVDVKPQEQEQPKRSRRRRPLNFPTVEAERPMHLRDCNNRATSSPR